MSLVKTVLTHTVKHIIHIWLWELILFASFLNAANGTRAIKSTSFRNTRGMKLNSTLPRGRIVWEFPHKKRQMLMMKMCAHISEDDFILYLSFVSIDLPLMSFIILNYLYLNVIIKSIGDISPDIFLQHIGILRFLKQSPL